MKKLETLQTDDASGSAVNRRYKDTLFRFIFREEADLLELYNAVNGSDYTDPDELEVTTLEDVIYIGMKNDMSFIIGDVMCLYEHQSTWNENMPLRGLFYFSELYKKLLDKTGVIISETRRKVIVPFPQYIVFYNGIEDKPERQVLRLSDSFTPVRDGETPCLECLSTVLNINSGHNKAIMEQCKKLSDYSAFIAEIRGGLEKGKAIGTAVDDAIDICIDKGILKEILIMSRNECRNSILTEYNRERHWETIRREAAEDGMAAGMEQGLQQGIQQGIQQGFQQSVMDILEEYGEIPDILRRDILSEEDMDTLSKWVKLASRCGSIDAFKSEYR